MARRTWVMGLVLVGLLVSLRGRDWLNTFAHQTRSIWLNQALAGLSGTAFGLEKGSARPQFLTPPLQADVWRQWGNFWANQEPPDWAQALVFYELALSDGVFADGDGLFLTRLQRARAWRGLGRVDEAVAEWEALLALRPQDYTVLLDLATTVWQSQGEFAAAEAYYQQAIAIDPQPIWAYRGLGLMYEYQGRTDEALAMFAEVLFREPNEPIALEHTHSLRNDSP